MEHVDTEKHDCNCTDCPCTAENNCGCFNGNCTCGDTCKCNEKLNAECSTCCCNVSEGLKHDCTCDGCTCTVDSHCGCFGEEGCTCGTDETAQEPLQSKSENKKNVVIPPGSTVNIANVENLTIISAKDEQ